MKMLRIKIAKRGRLRYNIGRSRQEGYGLNQLGTFIQVMTEKEAVKEGMEISGGIRFCKVEKIQGSYVGSLYIPSRAKNRSHTGFYFRIEKDKIIQKAPKKLESIHIVRTMPYPGFPTDIQSPFMALATVARGTSIFIENIFENRFQHVDELTRMGADIKVEGRSAVVRGVNALQGANVVARELRGGAALVVAALAANGTTTIGGTEFIDRGYENIEKYLLECGAKIRRE